MKMTRILSAILAALMLLPLLMACGNNDTSATTTTTAQIADTTTQPVVTEAPVPENERDELGEYHFNNQTFTILSRESTSYEVKSDEITGTLLSDAVYQRNATVEDRFDVKINVIETPGDWEQRDAFAAKVNNAVLADSADFDVAMTHMAILNMVTMKGSALNMNELDNINFQKRWWSEQYMKNVTFDGAVYAAIGDIGYTLYEYLFGIYFNKDLAQNAGISDLYQTVRDGAWTFDKLKEYTLLVGTDLDGNGVYNEKDQYGLYITNHGCRMCATFWEAGITTEGADGRQVINIPNEKYMNIYDQLYHFVWDNDQVYFIKDDFDAINMFMAGQGLFYTDRMKYAATIVDMDDDWGIIPFPKYDEQQEHYISSVIDNLSAVCVVNTVKDRTMVGTVLEALCMYSQKIVTPAYYETSLKLKYVNDPEISEMIDLIRDNMNIEFAMAFNNVLSYVYSIYGGKIQEKVSNISSTVKANKVIHQKLIDTVYDTFAGFAK